MKSEESAETMWKQYFQMPCFDVIYFFIYIILRS